MVTTTWFDVGFVLKCSYVVPLSNALQEEKWSLVQPLLSSSYIGYGTSSLKEVQASFGWNIFYIMGITRMFSLHGKKYIQS
jgi:hypothetical protein